MTAEATQQHHHGDDFLPAAMTEIQHGVRTPLTSGRRKRSGTGWGMGLFVSSMLLSTAAADCIPLATSTTCPAFKDAKVSTSDAVKSQL